MLEIEINQMKINQTRASLLPYMKQRSFLGSLTLRLRDDLPSAAPAAVRQGGAVSGARPPRSNPTFCRTGG